MKYVCLVYYDEAIVEHMPQEDWDSLNRECQSCVEGLKASGNFLEGHALMTSSSATTLRVRDGKPTYTDGPFAETREQLAGFYLLEARDLNHAILLANRIPPARLGAIEIRPVRELQAEHNVR